jgi:hypothetical protein
MTTQEKPEIPPHTKWGIRGTAVIILLLTALIIKNCIGSFMYGISTEEGQQKQYYEIGYSHGIQKAQGMDKPAKPETENLLLRKLYHKGYRNGWDSVQPAKKTQTSSEQPSTDK